MQAGLPVHVPAMTVNRFCSSGLQTIAQSAERIMANGADIIIAGGAETMSLVPMTGFRIRTTFSGSTVSTAGQYGSTMTYINS